GLRLSREETMTTTQQPIGTGRASRIMGLGVAAILATWAICALPVLAQAPAGIPGVLAPGTVAELVQEGFTFTEGPVGTADGGVYFSDIIGADKTYRIDAGGKIGVYRSGTNGTNGLALMRDGSLFGAEGNGKRISKAAPPNSTT